jgi:hypothetical protein
MVVAIGKGTDIKMNFGKALLFFSMVLFCIGTLEASASPPAVWMNDVSMFLSADAVVEAKVIKSRKWSKGKTFHLVAKYRVLDVFKGDISKDDIVIVTDTCVDRPVPKELIGYPNVEDHCIDGMNLKLTGVNREDGSAVLRPEGSPGWILFLKLDYRRGAPQQTWLELSRTSFYGNARRTPDDLPKEERVLFYSMLERLYFKPEGNMDESDKDFKTVMKLSGKWRGEKESSCIAAISGYGKILDYRVNYGACEYRGSLQKDFSGMFHGYLRGTPGKSCENYGELWLKIIDDDTVMVRSQWWKKGNKSKDIVFSSPWEPLKRDR